MGGGTKKPEALNFTEPARNKSCKQVERIWWRHWNRWPEQGGVIKVKTLTENA